MIREAYDVTGFDENQNMDPYLKQRQVLAKARGNPAVAPQKRGSLEMLQWQYLPKVAWSPRVSLKLKYSLNNRLLHLRICKKMDEAFQRHQLETEAAFQRHQKRKDENMQRFQAMMMQNLKD